MKPEHHKKPRYNFTINLKIILPKYDDKIKAKKVHDVIFDSVETCESKSKLSQSDSAPKLAVGERSLSLLSSHKDDRYGIMVLENVMVVRCMLQRIRWWRFSRR